MAEKQQSELILTFADFKTVLRRSKKKIKKYALIGSSLALLFAITRPVEYRATSTFREKGKSESGMSSSALSSLLLNGMNSSNNNEAASLFKSRTVLNELARRLNLQASIKENKFHLSTIDTLVSNLTIEWANLTNRQGPLWEDSEEPLEIQDLKFDEERSKVIRIRFISNEEFELIAPKGTNVAHGKLGIPFSVSDVHFTLKQKSEKSLQGRDFTLAFQPLYAVVNGLEKKVKVETDKKDRTLIKLKFDGRSRVQTPFILNSMMQVYQDYLASEQNKISFKQLEYLQVRQEEMESKLRQMMNKYATTLTSELISTGFPDASMAMDFLGNAQKQYLKELLNIDFELKKLQQAKSEGIVYFDHHDKDSASGINAILSRILALKKQADSLDISLKDPEEAEIADSTILDQTWASLKWVQQPIEETNQIIAYVKLDKIPTTAHLSDERFHIAFWCKKWEENPHCKAAFLDYLNKLQHRFVMQAKNIQEQMQNQWVSPENLQGLDLESAKALFIDYSKRLNEVEADILQKQFVVKQLEDPQFEVMSLSSTLNDPVSREITQSASQLAFSLRDQNNRTAKEQERIKNELDIQKGFLSSHLKQMIQLQTLSRTWINQNIRTLQKMTLNLIKEEISLLQSHLLDHVEARSIALTQEKGILAEHQQELQREMAKLPHKWISNKLIDHQMELNKRLMEEIVRLVETKSISNNLEVIQSTPVDYAEIEPQPVPPRLILFTLVGAALGAFVALCGLLASAVKKGAPVSEDNLLLGKYQVAGTLGRNSKQSKSILDHDLDVLRRLIGFWTNSGTKGSTLILNNTSFEYTEELAGLLAKQGQKLLIIPLFFDGKYPACNQGLVSYLEGRVERPQIIEKEKYDLILPGEVSRFGIELVHTTQFRQLLDQLFQKYDWVIAASNVAPEEGSAQGLINHFQHVVATISDQTWPEIMPLIDTCDKLNKDLSFVSVPTSY